MSSSNDNTNQNSVTNQQPNQQAPAPPTGPGSGSQATKSWASIAGKTALPNRPAASTGPTPSMPPAPSATPALFATPAAEPSVVSPAASSTASSAVAAPASPAAPAAPLKVYPVAKGESNVVPFPCKVDQTADHSFLSASASQQVEQNAQNDTFQSAPDSGEASSSETPTPHTKGDAVTAGGNASKESGHVSKVASKKAIVSKEPPPVISDQTYAARVDAGAAGKKIDSIRVNQFTIAQKSLPKILYRYSIDFSQFRGREVTNPRLKHEVILEALQHASLRTENQANNVYTDWKTWINCRNPLHHPTGSEVTKASGSLQIPIYLSQPAPPQLTIDLHGQAPLYLSDLYDYANGLRSQSTRFSDHTDALNIMSKHFAARRAVNASPLCAKEKLFGTQAGPALGEGLHARRAFFNSIRPVMSDIRLHSNALASAFVDNVGLHEFFSTHFGNFDLRSVVSQLMTNAFTGVTRGLLVQRVYTTPVEAQNQNPVQNVQTANAQLRAHGPIKRITGYGASAANQSVDVGNNVTQTVQQYFSTIIPGGLRWPNLPVANVGSNAPGQETWMPMELLRIHPGQRFGGMLEGEQTTRMIDFARKDPSDQVTLVQRDGMQRLGTQNLHNAGVMTISTSMATTIGRSLDAPLLQYGNRNSADGSTGRWDLRFKKFFRGTNFSHLRVIQITPNGPARGPTDEDLRTFARDISNYGIAPLNGNQRNFTRRYASASTSQELTRAYNQLPLPTPGENVVVLVIFPKHFDTYADVKRWADTAMASKGVHTVCLTQEKVDGKKPFLRNPGGRANLILKMNAKLNGINHTLFPGQGQELLALSKYSNTTMIVGADVTHPGPGSANFCPSIAGVVASTDKTAAQYPGSMRLQEGRVEQIIQLKDMMKERLSAWQSTPANGRTMPKNILFYRDGVSESQFPMVRKDELPEIRSACNEFATAYRLGKWSPKITLVVCTKRHQTRFFGPESKDEQAEKAALLDDNGGFMPGLVVDDPSVRLPYYFDFFLQSHKTLQGTARPCHYFVIENQMGLDADTLQEITFDLCWMYATALTPISMAAPTYYADKLCERGRAYVRPLMVMGRSSPNTDTWVQNLGNVTPQAKRQEVVRLLNARMGHNGVTYWPRVSPNPCTPQLQNSMFYI